ncbi:hypothetical protein [Halegenticoccus soli]|uniref:hypothetical protein n=1 Tax=Halegenticoccus soli TaxID=1985678 RepID=UPI001E5D0953|nr:hypothetical protein [Halegenticoccus soli]
MIEKRIDLKGNEKRTFEFNITRGLNVVQTNHTVIVSTYGNHTQFNFTREINTTDPGPIPKPEITDVKIANGTIEGEPSTVAEVTVSNPGIQTYSTKLMVHTEGTDGSFYGASVPPGENRTITVELLDERGAKVAGEARLYAGNLSKGDGAMDQVEFVGRANHDTTVWDVAYEPVRAPWRKNHYTYQNESIETGADKDSKEGFSSTQWIYLVAGVVLVALLAARRLR